MRTWRVELASGSTVEVVAENIAAAGDALLLRNGKAAVAAFAPGSWVWVHADPEPPENPAPLRGGFA